MSEMSSAPSSTQSMSHNDALVDLESAGSENKAKPAPDYWPKLFEGSWIAVHPGMSYSKDGTRALPAFAAQVSGPWTDFKVLKVLGRSLLKTFSGETFEPTFERLSASLTDLVTRKEAGREWAEIVKREVKTQVQQALSVGVQVPNWQGHLTVQKLSCSPLTIINQDPVEAGHFALVSRSMRERAEHNSDTDLSLLESELFTFNCSLRPKKRNLFIQKTNLSQIADPKCVTYDRPKDMESLGWRALGQYSKEEAELVDGFLVEAAQQMKRIRSAPSYPMHAMWDVVWESHLAESIYHAAYKSAKDRLTSCTLSSEAFGWAEGLTIFNPRKNFHGEWKDPELYHQMMQLAKASQSYHPDVTKVGNDDKVAWLWKSEDLEKRMKSESLKSRGDRGAEGERKVD